MNEKDRNSLQRLFLPLPMGFVGIKMEGTS